MVLFSVNLIFIFILNLFFCLELKFILNCSLFWWLDCVIHKFWIPVFIIHHFLCKHHYSLYRLHHRMKEKYKMNAKYLRALTTYLLSTIFFFPKLYWEKLSNQKSIGTWGFALLPRCRLFVLCGNEVNKIPSLRRAGFLIIRWKVITRGFRGHHMAVIAKTEEPGLLISTTIIIIIIIIIAYSAQINIRIWSNARYI